MKAKIFDVQQLKQFRDDKPNKVPVWSDRDGNINLICMKPGQEIITHTHHGSHVWFVMEGEGELFSAGKKEVLSGGKIVIVPALVDHGIRNTTAKDLVLASLTAKGD